MDCPGRLSEIPSICCYEYAAVCMCTNKAHVWPDSIIVYLVLSFYGVYNIEDEVPQPQFFSFHHCDCLGLSLVCGIQDLIGQTLLWLLDFHVRFLVKIFVHSYWPYYNIIAYAIYFSRPSILVTYPGLQLGWNSEHVGGIRLCLLIMLSYFVHQHPLF